MTFVKWNQIQTHACAIHIHMYTYIHNISVSVCVYLNWNHKWGHPPEVTHPYNASHLYSRNNKNYEQWKNFLYLTKDDKFNYKMYIIYCFFKFPPLWFSFPLQNKPFTHNWKILQRFVACKQISLFLYIYGTSSVTLVKFPWGFI